jgi:translation initiation factor IF-1
VSDGRDRRQCIDRTRLEKPQATRAAKRRRSRRAEGEHREPKHLARQATQRRKAAQVARSEPKASGESQEMARDDLIQATGTVEKILGGGRYQIGLDGGQSVTAQLSGRMRRFRIRVIPGDRVQVGLSPYDPSHGFITFRLRDGEGPQTVTE